MTKTARTVRALCVLLACTAPELARAQHTDTLGRDTTAERLGLWARSSRSSGLTLSSGKTYNRVEGLPVYIGPVFHDSSGKAAFNVSIFGIIRSADTFHWDNENLGHNVGAGMRVGRERGYEVDISSYDVVSPVEAWQLPEPDAGLASFFIRRDFRDYFNRHGAKATGTFHMSSRSSLSVEWSDERWAAEGARAIAPAAPASNPRRDNRPRNIVSVMRVLPWNLYAIVDKAALRGNRSHRATPRRSRAAAERCLHWRERQLNAIVTRTP